jgi:hypothetical protein
LVFFGGADPAYRRLIQNPATRLKTPADDGELGGIGGPGKFDDADQYIATGGDDRVPGLIGAIRVPYTFSSKHCCLGGVNVAAYLLAIHNHPKGEGGLLAASYGSVSLRGSDFPSRSANHSLPTHKPGAMRRETYNSAHHKVWSAIGTS